MPRVYFKRRLINHQGFTLVELLIALAIVALLAAIALPSYNEQVLRGRRADGKAFMLDLASRQERFFSQYISYTGVIVAPGVCAGSACGLGLGENLSQEDNYVAAIALTPGGCAPGGTSCRAYTITVTPVVADAKCTTLTYTSAGVQGATPAGNEDECWR